MEEREIALIGLLFHLLLRWRSLIVAGLIGVLLAGGYNAVKVVSDSETTTETEGSMTISDGDMEAVNVYASNVRMYESMQEAWSESAYMSLDGNNVAKTGVLLTIKGKCADRVANIAQAYCDMAVSIGAVDYICKAEGTRDTGIVELINVDTNIGNSTANSYTGDITAYICADDENECVIPIYIEVLGQDVDTSGRMADLLIEYLNQAKNDIVANMGEHSLAVLSRSTTVGVDSNVINKQNTNYNTLSRLYDTVTTQKAKLTSEQLEYYKSMLSEADTEDVAQLEDLQPDKAVSGLRSFISVKFTAIGLLVGVFCMACLWSSLYIFSNRIKPEDNIENLFKVAVVGVIPAEYGKKRIFGFIDKWLISIRDRNKRIFSADEAVSLAVSRVKVQSSKDKVSRLGIIGCDLGKNASAISEAMAEKLNVGGINASVLDNVLYDPENTEKLGEMDGAVIIEKAGRTLYCELADEIELLKRQQIKLLGCVIVE